MMFGALKDSCNCAIVDRLRAATKMPHSASALHDLPTRDAQDGGLEAHATALLVGIDPLDPQENNAQDWSRIEPRDLGAVHFGRLP
jgi:hypothetical protein